MLGSGLASGSTPTSFATTYLRTGGDIERLRKILGHSTYAMVMRYVHLDASDLHVDFDERTPF